MDGAGNNGSAFTAGALAHKKKLAWRNKRGIQTVEFLGSLYEYGSVPLGDQTKLFRELLEIHAIDDLVIGGWDISSLNLYEACVRNQVIESRTTRPTERRFGKALSAPFGI